LRAARLDVVNNDPLVAQQEPKFLFIRAEERLLEVLVAVAVASIGGDHECSVRAVEAHVERSLDADAVSFKALLLQRLPHGRFELVQARYQLRAGLLVVGRRRGLLQLMRTGSK
jgi:hypothetical protein